ncbi:MAG TPA: integrase core domain-containing protein [Gemmatimonadaceae bacterium]
MLPLHLILAALFGWLEREQHDAIEFLREENRVLKRQLRGRRVRLSDDERRRLAVIGQRLGRRMLADVVTIVTPDTILRWHRELIARKWTYATSRLGRPGVRVEIRSLVARMATDNPSWGYTRIQGALKNLGHRVARSTIAKILKDQGIPPSRERPMTWRTFLRAHWRALFAADFFTTEVWTARGLITYYTVFVIELHSRRIHVLGSTPHPDEAFVIQTMRQLTDAADGVLREHRLLICDRDRKWSAAVERFLTTAGVRVIRTPFLAPNCNAHAERFVRSIREECLDRVIPLGERHLRRTLADFMAHYHGERNHQGLGNELIDRPVRQRAAGPVRRRQRVGGVLSFYYRDAA